MTSTFNIPKNTGEEILWGAGYQFMLGSILFRNPYPDPIAGFHAAAISATATLVQAVVTSLFKKMAGTSNGGKFPWPVEILKSSIALVAAGIAFYGIAKIQLISMCILFHTARILVTALAERYPNGILAKFLNLSHLKASTNHHKASWLYLFELPKFA